MLTSIDTSEMRHAGEQAGATPVHFHCAAPRAKKVELAGDFNQWRPVAMARMSDGWWFAQLHLPHGRHRYRFIVDGKASLDPHASGLAYDDQNVKASLVTVA